MSFIISTGDISYKYSEASVVFWPTFHHMLTIFAVTLLVLWLIGLVLGYVLGGLIHLLLLGAFVLLLIRLIKGRNSPQV